MKQRIWKFTVGLTNSFSFERTDSKEMFYNLI